MNTPPLPPPQASDERAQLVNWSLLEDPAIFQLCRQSLLNDGVMTIPNFVTQFGIQSLKSEVLSCPYNESTQNYTPYQDQGGDNRYPLTHPRNFKTHSSASFVGRKSLQNAKEGLCVSLFDEDRLRLFFSRVASRQLYRSNDENGSVYSYMIQSHHRPPWHFDESPYTAIFYLQSSDGGGEFEYVPWCRETRTVDDEDGHGVIRKVLMDERSNKYNGIKQMNVEPGTLLFFSGAHTFHRAAPITGTITRIGLVFTFSDEREFRNSDSVTKSNEWDPSDASVLMQNELSGMR